MTLMSSPRRRPSVQRVGRHGSPERVPHHGVERVEHAEEGGRLQIRTIPAGTPAYEQGLNIGDQIVAIDGYRASLSFLQSYLADKKPNDTVKLSVFRFDKLREMDLKLGSDTRREYELLPIAEPTAEQKRLLELYLSGGQ